MAIGHIYIMINAAMPGYLKIGMTTRTPDERARELSQTTGVAVPYTVAYSEVVINCELAESMIHSRLTKFRVNRDREFFHLLLRDAIQELASIATIVGRHSIIKEAIDSAPTIAGTDDCHPLSALSPLGECHASDDDFAKQKSTHELDSPTEESLVRRLAPDLQRTYRAMRQRAIAFGSQVETYATRQNLIFKAGKVFAEIGPRKKCLSVLIRPDGFSIPQNTSALVHGISVFRVPDSHLWTLTHRFDVDANCAIENVEKLLRQSFNAVTVTD